MPDALWPAAGSEDTELSVNMEPAAGQYGNLEVCRLLLEHGANTDLQDVYGSTALMVAVACGHADVVNELLEAGANTAFKDRNDMTALDIAHDRKQGKIAKKLRRTAKRL